MDTASDPSPPTPLAYAVVVPNRIATRRAVVGTWAIPTLLHVLGWLAFFNRWPGDGPAVYARNILASISGPSQFIAAACGLVAPNSLPQYLGVAVASWLILSFVVCMRWARRLPLALHVVLSICWNLLGLVLYGLLCY